MTWRHTKEGSSKGGKKSSRKGIPNKTTAEAKERLIKMFDELTKNLTLDIKTLTAKERIYLATQVAEYIAPKLTRTEMKAEVEAKPQKPDLSKLTNEELDQYIALLKKCGQESLPYKT